VRHVSIAASSAIFRARRIDRSSRLLKKSAEGALVFMFIP